MSVLLRALVPSAAVAVKHRFRSASKTHLERRTEHSGSSHALISWHAALVCSSDGARVQGYPQEERRPPSA